MTKYLDPWFRDGRHASASPVVEPARYVDPSFRTVALPAAKRVPAWLVWEDDPDLSRRVAVAWHSGRLCFGRALTECVDKVGDVICVGDVPHKMDLQVFINHAATGPVGKARLFRRRDDVLACVVLTDSLDGHRAARDVGTGTWWGLSLGVTTRHGEPTGRGGHVLKDLTIRELSLTDRPTGIGCYLMAMNDSRFGEFSTRLLNISEKEWTT